MKLVTFSLDDGAPRIGVTDGAAIAPLPDRIAAEATDMIALIDQWDRFAATLRAIADFPLPLDNVRLHAPIARPGKIFALGLNYADHIAEAGREPPSDQLWFTKAGTAVNGPNDPILLPRVSEQLDYEAELVFVIGRRSRHVPADRAADAIFGYCVGNDVSVRDWQTRTSQYCLGKSFDTHAPFGPWIVTADEVDPRNLGIRAFVNGELRQNSNTRHLIFDCAAQVAHLSQAMTLEPGDVVFTGTPGGVGAAHKPPLWLREGDRVTVEIDGLGALENIVASE